jgi:ankyrin repeat protein
VIQPNELKLTLPVKVANNTITTTTLVWEMLSASYEGNLTKIKALVEACPDLIYAQFNYAPPIHFAVREGHLSLVKYLLENGAHDPTYKIYPFQESLQEVANQRGLFEIAALLDDYQLNPSRQKFSGDNGEIIYNRTDLAKQFEQAVDQNDFASVAKLLEQHPSLAKDETFFWSEGILAMPAKENHREMIDLLMSHGAKVPDILKWTQFYHFERLDGAAYMLQKGMNPNTMSWQHVSLLHDMAQKGDISKAELLIKYGAHINAIDEAYQSTPLGLAAKWGHLEMVAYLIKCGANVTSAGAEWATPLAWAKRKGHSRIQDILNNGIVALSESEL